ncbi:alpha/beta fold hydrolase [Mangrovicella endophytica]|uniref:alpha/beta fold hydrolase n=1 Tax=Mangrovicella endophytica TaxID=2066697 RepID=UPI0012FFDFDB|nr:alpha/beta hydrolase [Mangrovicella endophytica]
MEPSEFLTVGGVRLEMRRIEGSGTPILLLHEALGSVSLWGSYPERLAAAVGRPVVAWSRQGFGRSDPLPEPSGPDFLDRAADQTLALLATLGIDEVHLYGHSDGTAIALLVAARAPACVRSLVLEAPHVSAEPGALDAIRQMRTRFETGDLRERLARHHNDPDTVFENWAGIWLDPRFADWSIEDQLVRVRAPTLLIHGQDDSYFSTDQLRRIDAIIPATGVLILPDCGHSPFREQAEGVAKAAAQHILASEAAASDVPPDL